MSGTRALPGLARTQEKLARITLGKGTILRLRSGQAFQSCRTGILDHAALAAEGQTSSLNPGNAEQYRYSEADVTSPRFTGSRGCSRDVCRNRLNHGFDGR